MTSIARHGYYNLPEAARDWTAEQRWAYVSGRQQDAHVRRWYSAQRLRASDDITTESLLEALRGPKPRYLMAAE